MTIVTRFSPSPTGDLHLGSCRTALFSALHARHHGGKFLLRIEDTDRERSTKEAVKVIFDGLKWLGLEYDGEPVFQSSRVDRHREVVYELLANGTAYRCYLTPEETAHLKKEGTAFRSPYRFKDEEFEEWEENKNDPHVVRFKGPTIGETIVNDLVKGSITFQNENLDDLVLMRSDGTPTYNLAVVVDDHDAGVTTVIRGDDHLNNTPRQMLIYKALGWSVPEFAHIPLIYGEDGKKQSKRHGAASVMDFAELGYLPETMRNYLTRLGWGHGDSEIFTDAQAIEWFDVKDVIAAPARLDMKKLNHLNAHYIMEADVDRLSELVADVLDKRGLKYNRSRLPEVIELLREGATTIPNLADSVLFAVSDITMEDKAKAILDSAWNEVEVKTALCLIIDNLQWWTGEWHRDDMNNLIHKLSDETGVSMKRLGPPIRAALTGKVSAPDLGTCIMAVGGRFAALKRLRGIS